VGPSRCRMAAQIASMGLERKGRASCRDCVPCGGIGGAGEAGLAKRGWGTGTGESMMLDPPRAVCRYRSCRRLHSLRLCFIAGVTVACGYTSSAGQKKGRSKTGRESF